MTFNNNEPKLPAGMSTFNGATMSFSGSGYSDDHAIRLTFGIHNGASYWYGSWHNVYGSDITCWINVSVKICVYT